MKKEIQLRFSFVKKDEKTFSIWQRDWGETKNNEKVNDRAQTRNYTGILESFLDDFMVDLFDCFNYILTEEF